MDECFLRLSRFRLAGKISGRGRLALLFVGFAFFAAACADDSLTDNNRAEHHGHHGGHGRGGRGGRYGEPASPSPSPSPGVF